MGVYSDIYEFAARLVRLKDTFIRERVLLLILWKDGQTTL